MDDALDFPWIQTDGLTKSYKKKRALDSVTLNFSDGVTLLMGKNGSGKSTFISIIEGLCIPTFGTIRVFGMDPVKSYIEIFKRISFLPERPVTYDDGKVSNFFMQYNEFNHINSDTLDSLISLFQIDYLQRQKFKSLSLGEMQLVLLSAVLSTEREAYVLDEPNANLDQDNRAKLWSHLEKIAERGKKLLIVSHTPDQVANFSDSIILFNSGKVSSVVKAADYWNDKNNIYRIVCENPDYVKERLKDFDPIIRNNSLEVRAPKINMILNSLDQEAMNGILSIDHYKEDIA